jgi:hypothetical protein
VTTVTRRAVEAMLRGANLGSSREEVARHQSRRIMAPATPDTKG